MKKKGICLLGLLLSITLSGCGRIEGEVQERRSAREYCVINPENARIFSYSDSNYVILEEQVNRDELGSWVGYIQQKAYLGETYEVLELRENENPPSNIESPEGTHYVIPFYNVYELKEDGNQLVIDMLGSFHKTVAEDKITDQDITISYHDNSMNQ